MAIGVERPVIFSVPTAPRRREPAADQGGTEQRLRTRNAVVDAVIARAPRADGCCTGDEAEREAELASAVARRLGYSGNELDAIELGAFLHHAGRIGIPTDILEKPGPLTREEWAIVQRHPIVSELILNGIELHPLTTQIVRSSQEWIDGRGYPDGLAGDAIPLPARIALVADAFEALTSDRPYRARRPEHQALAEIRANAGTQFCPTVVAALDRIAREEPEILGTIPVWAVNVA